MQYIGQGHKLQGEQARAGIAQVKKQAHARTKGF